MSWLRYAWAFPTTCPGLVIVWLTLLTGGKAMVIDGVLEAHGGFASLFLRRFVLLPGGASAMTLGHVVIARDQSLLNLTRAHEQVHVRQAERWGPFFIPLYLILSLIAYARGLDPYLDNPFEREAFGDAQSL